jgi:hypothetical protein
MRAIIFSSVSIAALTLSAHTFAESLADAQEVFVSGNWRVLRSIDAMTDQPSCTGIYKNDYGIQLSESTMYIRTKTRYSSYQLRFDDLPANEVRLAHGVDARDRSLPLVKDEFSALIAASRLRVEVLTILGDLEYYDLDIRGVSQVLDSIKAGCPLPAAATKP